MRNWSPGVRWLTCSFLILFVGATPAVWAEECNPNEPDSGKRLKCKHERLLAMQEKVVKNMKLNFEGILPDEDLVRLERSNVRAKKAAGRTDSKQFRTLAKKQDQICELAELMDGRGDLDGICEPGEWCEELLDDGIGDDKQPCRLKGKKQEVCVEICEESGDAPKDEDQMEDPTDYEALADWEEMYDDVSGQMEAVNNLLETDGPALASLAKQMMYAKTPADACKQTIDWLKYSQVLALTISKQITVGFRGAADIAERGCDQTAPPGFNFSTGCIVLEGIAAVTALITETLEGVFGLVEWGFQNGTQSCMSVLSSDLQDAKQQLVTIKQAALSSSGNTDALVTEMGFHRQEFDTHIKDFASYRMQFDGHVAALGAHNAQARARFDNVDALLGDLRREQTVAFYARVEEALRQGQCAPTIWLPMAEGGKLETVRDHVLSMVDAAVTSGDPSVNAALARKHCDRANAMIARGEYVSACERLALAMQSLTK